MGIRRIFLAAVMLVALTGRPVFADDAAELKSMILELKSDYEAKIKSLEDKIERMEANQNRQVNEKVAALRSEIKEDIKGSAPDVEYVGRHHAPVGDGGLLVKNPFGFGNVSLGGYVDMEYKDLNNAESTFRQHRWIINIGAQPHERIRFNSELEIEYGGPDTAGGDGEVKVEQAYMDFLVNDAVNFRTGAILAPFGRYNLYHDSDLQDLTDRPLLARDIVPTTWTEAGLGFFGEFDPAFGDYEDLLLNYEVYVVNGLDGGFSDTGLGGGRSGLKTDNNDSKAVVGRLAVSPFLNQEIGVSGYWGEYDGAGGTISGVGVDTLNTFGPFELVTEHAYFGVDENTDSVDGANWFRGGYAQLNYHFWPEFLNDTPLGRNFDNPTLTLVGRYGWADIADDADTGTGDNKERRTTLGFNYRPTENLVFKFEYQLNNTDNEALEAGDGDGFVSSVALGF